MPHTQTTQNAPPAMQEALLARVAALADVRVAPSHVSVPGARGFHLDPAAARGPPEAFQRHTEFAHLHPPRDGSLHARLPADLAREAIDAGWAEPHPLAAQGILPEGMVMLYGPRDPEELETVFRLVEASWRYARG